LSGSYNLELNWLGEKGAFFLTGVLGKLESFEEEDGVTIGHTGTSETGLAARGSYFMSDRNEVTLSAMALQSERAKRFLGSVSTVLGISPRFYFMTDIVQERKETIDSGYQQVGLYTASRITYEPLQGVNLSVLHEFAKADSNNPGNRTLRYGIGSNYFPRPHYEIDLRWYRQFASPAFSQLSDLAWFQMHYYL
jgi:hypothetical protein